MRLIIFFNLIFYTIFGFAGVMNGGGGKGVLCKTATGEKLEVLDLYEQRVLHNLTPAPKVGNFVKEATWAIKQVGIHTDVTYDEKEYEKGAPQFIKVFFDIVEYIEDGKKLPSTSDATLPRLPPNCIFTQIALFYDNHNKILIDKKLWDKLDPRNQAALLLHEMLYRLKRVDGFKSSDKVRYWIARTLSITPLTPLFYDLPSQNYYECVAGTNPSGAYDFYIYPKDKGHIISFRQLERPTSLFRTTSVFNSDYIFKNINNPNTYFFLGLQIEVETQIEKRVFVISKDINDKNVFIWLEDQNQNKLTVPVELFCKYH